MRSSITAIYVDGCYNKHTKPNGWAVVTDQDGRDILPLAKLEQPLLAVTTAKGPSHCLAVYDDAVKEQQNNYAELVALTLGLRIALLHGVPAVYSDSQTIREYWSRGQVNWKKVSMGAVKKQWLTACQQYRVEYEKRGGKILAVSGASNPADPGWH